MIVLFFLKMFASFVHEHPYSRFRSELLEKEIDSNERAARDLQQLFAFMQESNRTALIPNEVIESTLPATFRRGHQQDSSEYLM